MAVGGVAAVSFLAAVAAFSAAVSLAASEERSQSSSSDTSSTRQLPEALRAEQEQLEQLLEALAQRAQEYESLLLRFVCEETLIRSEFNTSTGRRQKEDVRRHDYLLGRSRNGQVVSRRRPVGKTGTASWARLRLQQPDPFRWTLLFSRYHQKLFNYRLAGQEVVHFRLSAVVEFDPILPFVDGSEITQWAGRAFVDAETLDVLRVEAEPSGQQIRLEAATRDYHQAFRIIGVPLRRRPRAHLHEVNLTYERDGYRFPALAMTRRYVATEPQQRSLQTQVIQIFTDYQLFNVETDEKLLEIRGSEPPP